MSNAKLTVRTWGHNREGVYHLLTSASYPLSVVRRIEQWAVEHQLNLLHKKYFDIPAKTTSPQSVAALAASNKLWAELQEEGYNTEDDRHAITFLFEQHEDNPELINLSVAEGFLSNLPQHSTAC